MSIIGDTFARLRREQRAAFMPFLVAGDPDLDCSIRMLCEAAVRGSDLIEWGLPYSDPVADGPVIQGAFSRALSKGFKLARALDAFAKARKDIPCPVLVMVSYSIVRRSGEDAFLSRLRDAGIAGAIVPDLPPEEGAAFLDKAEALGLDTPLLVAPTTPPERRKLLLKRTRGFVYYVSVTGVTGARDRLATDAAARIAEIKKTCGLPVCWGFGVGTEAQAAEAARAADGVIVGSAIVRCIEEAGRAGTDPTEAAGAFIEQLARAVHHAGKTP